MGLERMLAVRCPGLFLWEFYTQDGGSAWVPLALLPGRRPLSGLGYSGKWTLIFFRLGNPYNRRPAPVSLCQQQAYLWGPWPWL